MGSLLDHLHISESRLREAQEPAHLAANSDQRVLDR